MARLAPLGDVYLRRAVKYDDDGVELALEYPYWIVWSTDSRPDKGGETLTDNQDITAVIGVTSVAETPLTAQIAAANARDRLGPASWVKLDADGLGAHIRWQSQVGGAEDQAVTLPDTGQHPSYEVDFYKLVSTPAKPQDDLLPSLFPAR